MLKVCFPTDGAGLEGCVNFRIYETGGGSRTYDGYS